MASKYSEKELAALEQKAKTPDSKVVCPRCGKELTYRAVGNSYEVKCPTEGCISLTVRGL
ncbi:MAG: hypothetical protein NC131_14335 [Roseburia sp.]|nr:hypothetical protein [Roseburia sp.]